MLNYSLGEIKFSVPSGWHEINFGKYLEIYKAKDNEPELIRILTGLDLLVILEHYAELQKLIAVTLEFVYEPMDLTDSYEGNLDISKKEIGRFIDLQNSLHSVEDSLFAYPIAVGIYATIIGEYDYSESKIISQNLENAPCIEVIKTGKYIVQQYNKFSELFMKPLQDVAFSGEESAAGLDDLMQKWGFYATMHYLCNGDILKFDAFVKEPAYKVYTLLNYLKDQNKYKEELQEIYKQKQKANGV